LKIQSLTYPAVNWNCLEAESRDLASRGISLDPYAYATVVDPELVHFGFLCETDIETFAELTALCSVTASFRVVKRGVCEFILYGSLRGYIDLNNKNQDLSDELTEFLNELYGTFRGTELRHLF
jgi:hypothetical protein